LIDVIDVIDLSLLRFSRMSTGALGPVCRAESRRT
jgi:hypothetical protein